MSEQTSAVPNNRKHRRGYGNSSSNLQQTARGILPGASSKTAMAFTRRNKEEPL